MYGSNLISRTFRIRYWIEPPNKACSIFQLSQFDVFPPLFVPMINDAFHYWPCLALMSSSFQTNPSVQ